MKQKLHEPLTKRQAIAVVALLCVAATLGWAGWKLYGKWNDRPQSAATVKRAMWKEIRKHARAKEFHPPFDVTTVSLRNANVVTNSLGQARISLTSTTSRGLPETTASEYFRTNHAQTTTYEAIYQWLGEQLQLSEQLLAGTNAMQHFAGLVLASEATIYARTNAYHHSLSARIAQGLLWPNLHLVAATNKPPVAIDKILELCEDAFVEAGDIPNAIRNYEIMMVRMPRAQEKDLARFRLAQIYIDRGEDEKALQLFKAISTIRTPKYQRDLFLLEQRLALKKRKG